ncbi:MAG: APC family permease [Rhodoglobus sp.]
MSPQTTSERGTQVETKGLKKGALGLVSSVAMGMACAGPAYSLAASLGLIVASGGVLLAGVKTPGVMVLAFVPMYFIAVAYQELNKAEPDCGTTFTWASRAFGPVSGWLGGWAIIVANIILMSSLAHIAGAYSFTLLSYLGIPGIAELADSVLWSTVAGLIWIVIMTWVSYRGIDVSVRLQCLLLSIELVVLLAFAIYALVRVYGGTAESYSLVPSLEWFNPFTLDFGSVIAPAILTTIFLYWGWDTAVTLNEESDNQVTTPGRAAVISTMLLVLTYALIAVAAIAFAGVGTAGIGLGAENNATDIFAAIGPELFDNSVPGTIMLVLLTAAVLISTSASTQASILPAARTALSMAVHKAVPAQFARIHALFKTPTWSTVGMGIISAAFYLLFTLISPRLLSALIGSIGLIVAFYYALTGFACVWYYRATLTSSVRNFVARGLLPLLGGATLSAVFGYGLFQFAAPDWLVDDQGNNITIFGIGAQAVVGLGPLIVGLSMMGLWALRKSDFFRGLTLATRSFAATMPPRGQ